MVLLVSKHYIVLVSYFVKILKYSFYSLYIFSQKIFQYDTLFFIIKKSQ